jgi:hypothetical protein
MIDQSLAPGCFGSPIIYKGDGPICSLCMFSATCAPRSQARRTALQAQFKIEVKSAQITIASRTPEVAPTPALYPVKVVDLLERIERAGVTVTDKLRQGVNPFTNKPGFMRIACDMLLRATEGVKRTELCFALMTQLNWTSETAASHTSQAIHALTALGAITNENGRITLKGNG